MTSANQYIRFFVSFTSRIWYLENFGTYSGTKYRDEIRTKMQDPQREPEELSAIMEYTWMREHHTYNIVIGYDRLITSSWLTVPIDSQNPIGPLKMEIEKILEDLENILKYANDIILKDIDTDVEPGTLFFGWQNMGKYIRSQKVISQLTREIGNSLLTKSPNHMWLYSRGSIREEKCNGDTDYDQIIASEAVLAGVDGIPLPDMARDWLRLNLDLHDSNFAEIELFRKFRAIRQDLSENAKRCVRKGPSGELIRDKLMLENKIEILTERVKRLEKKHNDSVHFNARDSTSIPPKQISHPIISTVLQNIAPSLKVWDPLDSIRNDRFCDFPIQRLARDFKIQRRMESATIRRVEVIFSIGMPFALLILTYILGGSRDDWLSLSANIIQVSTFIVVLIILSILASKD